MLGSAPDPRIQNDFVNLANELHSSYHDRARLCLTYDEPLSHLVCINSVPLFEAYLCHDAIEASIMVPIEYADICWR